MDGCTTSFWAINGHAKTLKSVAMSNVLKIMDVEVGLRLELFGRVKNPSFVEW